MSFSSRMEDDDPKPNTIKETVLDTAEKLGKDPSKTLVTVDLSNVNSWYLMERELSPHVFQHKHVIDYNGLADLLTDENVFAEARVFMPAVKFERSLVDPVTDWVMANHIGLFNSRRFEMQDDPVTYGVKLGTALSEYLTFDQRRNVSSEIREKIRAVIRGAHLVRNAEMFASKGCQVFTKPESLRQKSLFDDRHHRRVVKKILDTLEDLDSISNEMRVKLLDLFQGEATDAVDDAKEMVDMITNIRQTIEKDVSEFHKCDLDPDIVAESLDPATIGDYDSQVFFSGDGDFAILYDKLHHAGKNVVVVSPDAYLSRNVKRLASQDLLTIHNPNLSDRIWRRVY